LQGVTEPVNKNFCRTYCDHFGINVLQKIWLSAHKLEK